MGLRSRRGPTVARRILLASVVSSASLFLVGACGRIAEPTNASGDDDAGTDASLLDLLAPPDAPAPDLEGRVPGCSDLPPGLARSVEGGASTATHVTMRGGGGEQLSFHSPYGIGSFAPGAIGGDAAAVCGERGVYSVRYPCGYAEVAACDGDGASTAARSCIYLSSLTDLLPQEHSPPRPAGHYVDVTGRCWELSEAAVELGRPADSDPGGAQSGRFEVTAIDGTERKRLSGSFVTCVAFRVDHTCR